MRFQDLLAYKKSLEYARACEYINHETFDGLTSKSLEVGKLLNYMMTNPDKFN